MTLTSHYARRPTECWHFTRTEDLFHLRLRRDDICPPAVSPMRRHCTAAMRRSSSPDTPSRGKLGAPVGGIRDTLAASETSRTGAVGLVILPVTSRSRIAHASCDSCGKPAFSWDIRPNAPSRGGGQILTTTPCLTGRGRNEADEASVNKDPQRVSLKEILHFFLKKDMPKPDQRSKSSPFAPSCTVSYK